MHQRSTSYAQQDVVEFPHIMCLVQCHHDQIHVRIPASSVLVCSFILLVEESRVFFFFINL
ncbi:hypothetical protein NC652_022067 [Populus alba x Populus x berolinensis]|uniref:Uncharacterized protein n=1 Tax=Populus alba x Populus x berolinensis TaxID=444605 RepID=A0AAD6MPD8_9ROSI|nr:hypothetical protein NC652_022067 [Populus alba x Populus x berolinensis]KAJ6989161.1 hypothetical protein NC653_021906 [Populus alba x Populus x berolinensis]